MELSPKQQTVEQIKKANRILILGHKNPSGDFLGSALAFQKALSEIGKSVEVVLTDPAPEIFQFLPNIDMISTKFAQESGKVLRINTKKIPIKSVKFQKEAEHLDFILEAEKNLKFEYIEIINGEPKPDLIIVLNTPDVEKIDAIYDQNTELFFEVPVLNIDHHAGNEYFGTVNLVDLTATSTAEILVALFEALGIKIADADSATLLLAGIISETQSFRSGATTPKSLTVAAQLLAAGGRQQEIVNNLYRRRPMALMKIWGEMIADIKVDENHKFAWTRVKLDANTPATVADIMESADELLSNNPETEIVLILAQKGNGPVVGKFKSKKGQDVLALAQLFEGEGVPTNASFELNDLKLGDAELLVLKTLADFWGEEAPVAGDLWNVVEKSQETEIEEEMTTTPAFSTEQEIEKEMTKGPKATKEQEAEIEKELTATPNPAKDAEIEKEMVEPEKQEITIKGRERLETKEEDVIEAALNSIEKEETKIEKTKTSAGSFSSIGEVLYKKTADFEIPIKHANPYNKGKKQTESSSTQEKEIDVFDEDPE